MPESETRMVELNAAAVAILVGILVLSIAPLYLLVGDPAPYYLGVPWWAWVLVVVHYVLLGLVVVFVRQLGIIESVTGGTG